MNNEIKINVPEGMEIDKENSTFECIKFKPIKKELPKTWKEFCKNNKRKPNEAFIENNSRITELRDCSGDGLTRDYYVDANLLPSREYAEAMLALCKLIQLRDCYNDGWKADWNSLDIKYTLCYYSNKLIMSNLINSHSLLAFKTECLRDAFCKNFRDLIEQAKLLL